MTKEEKADLKIKLKLELDKTALSIEQYEISATPIKPENSLGRLSRLDAINNKSVLEAALREAKNRLKNLKVMYIAIDGEKFGLCAKCHNHISIARLMFRPESRYCVHCAR